MNTIPQYCQNCREKNDLGEQSCRRCGTRLMLVVFPQSLKYDTNYVPTYYEDHLLERVTSLELRLSQITERLAMTLDLLLRQSKTTQSDHLLLETLIESLNSLGALEKEKLTKNWRERVAYTETEEKIKTQRERLLDRILAEHAEPQADLLVHLINEGLKFLSDGEEKQGLRTLERALLLSPRNVTLILLLIEYLMRADKTASAKTYLEKAHLLAPADEKVSTLLAILYADENSFEQAKSFLSLLPETERNNFCASYIRGMIASAEENWTDALQAFKHALKAKDSPEVNYLSGCVNFQLGRHKTALKYLQKAVEADADFADAWFMLSLIYEKLNKPFKSREAAEHCQTIKESGAQCLEYLNRRESQNLTDALPFAKFKKLKTRVLTGGALRLTKFFRQEMLKIFE